MNTIKSCLKKGGIYAALAHLWMASSWPPKSLYKHGPADYLAELERHEGQIFCYVAVTNSIWSIMRCVAICAFFIASIAAVFEAIQGAYPGYMFYVQNVLGFILCLLVAGRALELFFGTEIKKEIDKHEEVMSKLNFGKHFESDFKELSELIVLPEDGFDMNGKIIEDMAWEAIRKSFEHYYKRMDRATSREVNEWAGGCLSSINKHIACFQKFGLCMGENASIRLDKTMRELQERVEQIKIDNKK